MAIEVARLRNIGISAHIDSGKTTLTERILYYAKRIHRMHEVKGADGVGATMDSMELERERGITIASAATHCGWKGCAINIIDTPGHVDFTIEVERALRVLDGAVLVLCAVAGVQSQSLTVDRQMRRYAVPRIAFVNKCDRVGADPHRVCRQLREQLGLNPVLLQLPLGLEEQHAGVIDLVEMRALRFEGRAGEAVQAGPIPAELEAQARRAREEMLDLASMFSDELTEAVLSGEAGPEIIRRALRQATREQKVMPVLLGSAYKNKGVQPLLDAVVDYLPAPDEIAHSATDTRSEQSVPIDPRPDAPALALVFKIEDSRFGQLSYLRIYQGTLRREDAIVNVRTGRRSRIGRLVRMHADDMEQITEAAVGDIVAIFGIDCNSGDTFTDGRLSLAMASMHVPEPVISLSVQPADQRSADSMSKALRRFSREDPTFRVRVDAESGQTVIAGMGELHLEVYLERMRREYGAGLSASAPRVAYRETLIRALDFDYTHKKQTGGSGQYGRVRGRIEPMEEGDFDFVDQVTGGRIPKTYIPAVRKGFESMLAEGPILGAPMTRIRIRLQDGAFHEVDSSDLAFQEAARGAWRKAIRRADLQLLEPVMRVAVEGPAEHFGAMLSSLVQRRAVVLGSSEQHGQARIQAEVPLAEMFGYSTVLRSATEGKAEFSMEFDRYQPVPASIADELAARAAKPR
ncbi:MAG: elongation factor G [Deltaproteobacteria bacterium]|nr:elongation factor G [Deltaproteobacteria bacterium]